jgi:hypothetical protein
MAALPGYHRLARPAAVRAALATRAVYEIEQGASIDRIHPWARTCAIIYLPMDVAAISNQQRVFGNRGQQLVIGVDRRHSIQRRLPIGS